MKEQFIPYELSVKLKFLGFDEKCFDMYQDDTNKKLAGKKECTKKVLWQQAFDWFREKHQQTGVVWKWGDSMFSPIINFDLLSGVDKDLRPINLYKTHEEARKACLEKLIEIVQNNI